MLHICPNYRGGWVGGSVVVVVGGGGGGGVCVCVCVCVGGGGGGGGGGGVVVSLVHSSISACLLILADWKGRLRW